MAFFHHWPDLCRAMERPDLIEDPLYSTDLARLERREESVKLIEELAPAIPLMLQCSRPSGAIRRSSGASALCRRNP
jgi:hypothetical protein